MKGFRTKMKVMGLMCALAGGEAMAPEGELKPGQALVPGGVGQAAVSPALGVLVITGKVIRQGAAEQGIAGGALIGEAAGVVTTGAMAAFVIATGPFSLPVAARAVAYGAAVGAGVGAVSGATKGNCVIS